MKQFKYFPLSIFFILLLLSSCKKYLDEKSDASLLVPTSLSDFQYLMDDATTMNNATPGFGTSSGDDYFIDNNAYNAKTTFLQHVYRWEPYPYRFNNDWAQCYKAIYVSNLCLERLPLLPRDAGNSSEWDQIKGSALFYKAFYHLELAWLFAKAYDSSTADGDLGIVLREGTDFLLPSVRSTVAETYEKIIVDAKQGAGLLSAVALVPTRPSKAAAYALLARTYLSMREYDSAGRYAGLALQLKSDLLNYNDASQVALSSANPFKLFNKEVVFHSTMNTTITLHSPTSGPARIDTTLFLTFHINDLRRKAFFTAIAGYNRFKGSYSATTSRLFSGIATDELYLMRAECAARAGNAIAAVADLNSLLQMRFAPANFIPVTAVTAEDALSVILIERRKELMFRGSLRWMDVKRLNKEAANITMQRLLPNGLIAIPPNDNKFALPIPQDVIETSGIQQN